MSVVVFGIDPGKSCGLALFVDVRLAFLWQGSRAELLPLVLGHLAARAERNGRDQVCIAMERYVPLGRPGSRTPQSDALEVIGAVTTYATEWNVKVTLQSPSDARALVSDDLLRKLNLYATGSALNQPDGDDANMALRHALLHMAIKHNTLFQQLISSV